MKTMKLVAGTAMMLALGLGCEGGGSGARLQTAGSTGGAPGLAAGGAAQGAGGAVASGGAGGGDGRVPLVSWVGDLAQNHNGATDQPDTVEDKVPIIIDTDDPAAFDPLLGAQPQSQP
jgi:hypothetical protein